MSIYSTTLGDFLRARRDACQPEEVGLRREYGRRVSGLRRDEVARLAGMSSEYYMRLEQGRVDSPSRQVVDALARALQMSSVTTDYLYRLAGLSAPRDVGASTGDSESLVELLQRWHHMPAYVADGNFDIVAANEMMIALTQGEITAGANTVALTFTESIRSKLDDWESTARATVGALRYLGDERSARFNEILQALSKDPDFARLWALHEVCLPIGYDVAATVEGLGDISVRIQNFAIPDLHAYTVTIYLAVPGSTTESVFDQIAQSLKATV